MSPQASAQALGPCTGLHRYQPHFYGCVSGLITAQAGTLSVEANASLREDFTVTVSIEHDWSLGSELGDTGWRLDAVEVHYYVVSGADREQGWFDVADATSSVSRGYFIEAGQVFYHYSATLKEIDPEPGPVYNTFYVPGGEPVPFDRPYLLPLPWTAGSTATTTPTLYSLSHGGANPAPPPGIPVSAPTDAGGWRQAIRQDTGRVRIWGAGVEADSPSERTLLRNHHRSSWRERPGHTGRHWLLGPWERL